MRLLVVIIMPLVCQELSLANVSNINRVLQGKSPDHPLRKESVDGQITVVSSDGAAVFHSAAGFSFRRIRENLYTTILEEIDANREHLCSALHLKDLSMVPSILDRFVEAHGRKLANKIDHIVIDHDGKLLMLLNLPTCVVRHMIEHTGGRMSTGFSGSVDSLRKIPMLAKYGNIVDTEGNMFRGCVMTEYKKDAYAHVRNFHYAIVQEVISRPDLGVTLLPVACWDA